jgi:hypothetical protein
MKQSKRFREYVNESEQTIFLAEADKEYDHEIAYLYQQNAPISSIKNEIEATYGSISFGEIYRSLRRNQISPSRRTKPFRDDVVYFGHCGLELEEIATLTGYSKRQVRNILKADTEAEQDDHIGE